MIAMTLLLFLGGALVWAWLEDKIDGWYAGIGLFAVAIAMAMQLAYHVSRLFEAFGYTPR
jgi:isoprenylcysteine carboxyl methyltransferase (ICMT) family protein YpbQ